MAAAVFLLVPVLGAVAFVSVGARGREAEPFDAAATRYLRASRVAVAGDIPVL